MSPSSARSAVRGTALAVVVAAAVAASASAAAAALPQAALPEAASSASSFPALPSGSSPSSSSSSSSSSSAYAAAVAAADPSQCPAGVITGCAQGTTCCPIFMSQSGYGCCHIENAVCCPVSPGVQSCCPPGSRCVPTGTYSAICQEEATGANITATQVCTPGARYPPAQDGRPSMIVIGDSVSEGYQPPVAALLNTSIFVQHSPWSVGGGADDVANGVNCEEEFLRTADYSPANWSLISFNFGLHNVDNATAAEDTYEALLVNFTDRLLATGSRLVFVTTTPFMPAKLAGDYAVEDMNARAKEVMAARGIPVADLYQRVIDFCGELYSNCSICDNEYNPATGITCGYHYTPAGWQYLAEFLAPIFAGLLSA